MILTSLVAVASIILESYMVAAAGLLAVSGYNIWAWTRVELFAIDPEDARAAAGASGWLVVILLFVRIFLS